MLRAVDIAVLLKLTLPDAGALSFQKLASDLHLASSEVHGTIRRARLSGMMQNDGPKSVNRSVLLEILEHGFRYIYPAVRGEIMRGLPTSFAAEPLRSLIHGGTEEIPVWPSLHGQARGYSLEPLYKHAAEAAEHDPLFYELLSLADAVRDGRARERKFAMELLEKKIRSYG